MKQSAFHRDDGAVLVMVLALLAMLAIIALLVVEATAMGIRRTGNLESMTQARWHLAGAETFARARIAEIKRAGADGGVDQADWQGKAFTFPLDQGALAITLRDGSNCFNLNGVVTRDEGGAQVHNLTTQVQLARLIAFSGARGDNPMRLAASLADWIDADGIVSSGGAEDDSYADQNRRAANAPLGDISELRKVRGFSAEIIDAIRPWVCVRPIPAANILNVNSLTLDQAPLLAATLGAGVSVSAAEGLIRDRPRGGWTTRDAFFSESALAVLELSPETRAMVDIETRYFVMSGRVLWRQSAETMQTLIDTAQGARAVRRVLGLPEKEQGL